MEREKNLDIQYTIEIIETVLSDINEALEQFRSARKWGTFDMFFGGFITSIIKRNKIRKGNYICEQIRKNLNKLSFDKLQDLQYKDDLLIGDGFWDNFFDVYADNFFSDWMVRDKIVNLITRLEVLEHRLEKVYNELNKI